MLVLNCNPVLQIAPQRIVHNDGPAIGATSQELLQCRLSQLNRTVGIGRTARDIALLPIDRPRSQGIEVNIGSTVGQLIVDNDAAGSAELVRHSDTTGSRVAARTIRRSGKKWGSRGDRRTFNKTVVVAADPEE